ncbi:hypothetical protein KUCAC02_029471, partial [Chaenocephalus aceratus]
YLRRSYCGAEGSRLLHTADRRERRRSLPSSAEGSEAVHHSVSSLLCSQENLGV